MSSSINLKNLKI